MEHQKDSLGILDLMIRPGFCVKENKIVRCNRAAQGLLLSEGDDILPLLLTGKAEYEAFRSGCLYLSLRLNGQDFGASVTRMDEGDVFILDQESDQGELQAMALAARELREPLANVMISADKLLRSVDGPDAARLNQGLYQMLRIIGNMSDAVKYTASSRQEIRDISALVASIFEKAGALVEQADIHLEYTGCEEAIYCLVDEEQLERAVLNILSNAIRFLPKGGTIQAEFVRCGRSMRLSVLDSGSGIAQEILTNVFRQYLRQPGLEEGRHGIGLGMVLIRSTAANHGGTVLIDQPEKGGTRITVTFAIRQDTDTLLRSPILRVDYAGERDHALLELSESLPSKLYKQ